MLTCYDMTDLVTRYYEGALPVGTRMQVWMHLAMCKHCRAFFKQIRDVAAASGSVETVDVPPQVESAFASMLETVDFDNPVDPDLGDDTHPRSV